MRLQTQNAPRAISARTPQFDAHSIGTSERPAPAASVFHPGRGDPLRYLMENAIAGRKPGGTGVVIPAPLPWPRRRKLTGLETWAKAGDPDYVAPLASELQDEKSDPCPRQMVVGPPHVFPPSPFTPSPYPQSDDDPWCFPDFLLRSNRKDQPK